MNMELCNNKENDKETENKYIFLNPIFVDKLDYLDLKENLFTYLFIIIFIILIVITLYYFFYDEILIIYYFLIKKDYEFNEIENELIKLKVDDFNKYFEDQNYECHIKGDYKYYIKTKDNIFLEDIHGKELIFDNQNDCQTLLNTALNKSKF